MKQIDIIKKALPILEKLEQDYIDGNIPEDEASYGLGRLSPSNIEKLTEVSRLIYHARLAVKESK